MARVEIERIECVECSTLTREDDIYIASLSAGKRRRECSAWRALLRRTLAKMNVNADGEIRYSEVGAPYILGSDIYIGVSHSKNHVAIIIADTPCAIDIEECSRDFARVASRFTTEMERSIECNIDTLPLIWSAKETLYKISGRSGLDLIHDITITNIDDHCITGYVAGVEHIMHYTTHDTLIVVYTPTE